MKRHPRLPNGFGSISKLSGKRKNPYCVRPPTTLDDDGNVVRQKPICYTDTWYHGFAVLVAWKAGTYEPGMEREFKDTEDPKELVKRIIDDYRIVRGDTDGNTVETIYRQALRWHDSHKHISKSSLDGYELGFKHLKPMHGKSFASITTKDIQDLVDKAKNKSARKLIILALSLCYKYAMASGIATANLTQGVIVPTETVKHGEPFTEEEINLLWANRKKSIYYTHALIMIYSGFRGAAYPTLEVNLDEWYFKGGVKTAAGKGRIVPIHTCIRSLVVETDLTEIRHSGYTNTFIKEMKKLGMTHTPHDCRHTFSALCERYGVRENDRKRLLGHAFGDVTNDVYGHRTLEELRAEIEKICCTSVASKSQQSQT